MWGAPGSGKTTFLAALSIALNRRRDGWKVVGADSGSTQALVKMTTELATDRAFPEATQGLSRYKWFLVGQVEEQVGRWYNRKTVRRGLQLGLDLLDPSGELY